MYILYPFGFRFTYFDNLVKSHANNPGHYEELYNHCFIEYRFNFFDKPTKISKMIECQIYNNLQSFKLIVDIQDKQNLEQFIEKLPTTYF